MFDELPEGNYDISTFMDDNGDIIGIYIYSILFYIYIIVIIDTLFLGIPSGNLLNGPVEIVDFPMKKPLDHGILGGHKNHRFFFLG